MLRKAAARVIQRTFARRRRPGKAAKLIQRERSFHILSDSGETFLEMPHCRTIMRFTSRRRNSRCLMKFACMAMTFLVKLFREEVFF